LWAESSPSRKLRSKASGGDRRVLEVYGSDAGVPCGVQEGATLHVVVVREHDEPRPTRLEDLAGDRQVALRQYVVVESEADRASPAGVGRRIGVVELPQVHR